MDCLLALILVIGIYYILELYLKHREKMATINKDKK